MSVRCWSRLPFLIIGAVSTTFALEPLPILRAELDQLAKQIEQVRAEEADLLSENERLAGEISAKKRRLQEGDSRLLELQLQDDLKVSRERSHQIQALDDRIRELTERSIEKKRNLLDALKLEIGRLSEEATAAEDAGIRDRALAEILRLQRDVETHRKQIQSEADELLLALDVVLTKREGPDEIQQKLTVLRDQRDIVRAKIEQLGKQIIETKKTLALRQNMLALLRDIRRGEEDEFDLDQNLNIAGLEDAIAGASSALNGMQTRKESWVIRERLLIEKVNEFSLEIERMLEGE